MNQEEKLEEIERQLSTHHYCPSESAVWLITLITEKDREIGRLQEENELLCQHNSRRVGEYFDRLLYQRRHRKWALQLLRENWDWITQTLNPAIKNLEAILGNERKRAEKAEVDNRHLQERVRYLEEALFKISELDYRQAATNCCAITAHEIALTAIAKAEGLEIEQALQHKEGE